MLSAVFVRPRHICCSRRSSSFGPHSQTARAPTIAPGERPHLFASRCSPFGRGNEKSAVTSSFRAYLPADVRSIGRWSTSTLRSRGLDRREHPRVKAGGARERPEFIDVPGDRSRAFYDAGARSDPGRGRGVSGRGVEGEVPEGDPPRAGVHSVTYKAEAVNFPVTIAKPK
jgi:hypothetical protein